MARKDAWIMWVLSIVTLLSAIALGELFTSGAFLNTQILGIVPDGVHTFIGWILIISGVIQIFKRRR